ncbi:MAG: PAS domain-containing sensor histidine kinase [Deltaproteobacteria bacterium]|nr:PAS domain-containing sensor histidine kinase [Deltaproteobacteria bacterium]
MKIENEVLNSIIELNPYAIGFGDKEGHVFKVNKAFIDLFGSAPPPDYNIYKDPNLTKPEFSELFEKMRKGETVAFPEIWFNAHKANPNLPDKEICVRTVVFAIKGAGGDILYFIAMHEDITKRKRLEKIKDEFIGIVSHELRTPLTILKEGLSQVLDGLHGAINNKLRDALTNSLSNVERLTKNIQNLLVVSQVRTGDLQLKKAAADIVSLIKKSCSKYKVIAKKNGLKFNLKAPSMAVKTFIDAEKIIKAFEHLLENAVKFTNKGEINVELRVKDKHVECLVSDTGTGIASEDMPRLFELFEQIERKPGPGERGVGIGLAIVKGIILLHGGKIWAESKLGRGTKITFSIPRKI